MSETRTAGYVLPETVETDCLLLRMWQPEDAAALDEIFRQPEYLEHMPPTTGAKHVAAWRRQWENEGFGHWAACERASGRRNASRSSWAPEPSCRSRARSNARSKPTAGRVSIAR